MMRHSSLFRTWAIAFALILCCTYTFGQGIPLKNWTVPKHLSIAANSDITDATPFFAVTPCRIVDTRNPNGPYGGPALVGGGPARTFNIPGGPCTGIPTSAGAYSLNFTVVNVSGPNGFLTAYPTGSTRPTVSSLNFTTGQIVGNGAIVPAGTGGSIDIYTNDSTDLIIDINGYYMSGSIATPWNTGQHMYLYANTPAEALFVWNLDTTNSYAPSIVGYMSATVSGRAAVRADSVGTSGATFGLRASNASTTDGAAAVSGESSGTSGILSGVMGHTASTTAGAAGVAGSVGTGANTSGLLGTTGGVTWTGDPFFFAADVGVKGKAQRGIIGWGTGLGVAGIFVKADGTAGGEATLGASATSGLNVSGDGNVTGNFSIGGTLSKGAGTFKIDHPLDPENKILYHSFVESPDMMNIYNGVVQLDANGEATVQLPNYFEALNQDFRYQLTAMGRPQPNLYIADEVNYNMFRISGGRPNAKVSWTVTGIRHDVFANAHRVIPEVMKTEAERGYYLHPVERGEPLTKSIEAVNASDEMMLWLKQREAERLRNAQNH